MQFFHNHSAELLNQHLTVAGMLGPHNSFGLFFHVDSCHGCLCVPCRHEVAEVAGLLSFSFGTEGQDRHTVLFRKEAPPSEEELQALRNGEVD